MKLDFSRMLPVGALCVTIAASAFAQDKPLPRRAHVGIAMAPATEGQKGARIQFVGPNSPSAQSGIKVDDIILQVGDTPIADTDALMAFVKNASDGGNYKTKILRDGREIELTWEMKALPKEDHPGFETIYDHVTLPGGHRQRTFIVKPKGDGPFPALFFLQGLQCASTETPNNSENSIWKSVNGWASKGYVVFRVEKSGIGDSEGPPCSTIDFETEYAGYKAGLEKLKTYKYVQPEQVYLFGHSMGGYFAPKLAQEEDVAGVITYGTGAKNWIEYVMEINRSQSKLAGATWPQAEQAAHMEGALQFMLLDMEMSPEEIVAKRPEFEELLNQNMPDGKTMWSRDISFFRQLYRINGAELWAGVDTPSLIIWGTADYVANRDDNEYITQIVNEAHPGKSTFLALKDGDHAFNTYPSFEAAMKGGLGKGDFNASLIDETVAWMAKVAGTVKSAAK